MKASDLLTKHNLKHTEAREAIYTIVSHAKNPVDVLTVVGLLKKFKLKVDQATIYRTIQTFVDHGIFRQIELREGKFRYELSSLPHHHHIVCTQCGAIDDIDACGFEELIRKITSTKRFHVTQHNAEFFGLCHLCKSKS